MRTIRLLVAVTMLLTAGAAMAQRQNTFYVDQFDGATVGAKAALAQAACNPSYPCVLIFDTSLALLPNGSMPAKCSGCSWVDWRSGGGITGGLQYADNYPGATPGLQIQAAAAACPAYSPATGGSCVVVAPPLMACGEPGTLADNVLFIDYRNCAQSQGLRFNLSTGTTQVRSKMFLQDNYNAGTVGLNSGSHGSSTLYVLSYPDSPNLAKNTVEAGNASISINTLTGNMTVPLIGFEAESGANPIGGGYTVSDVRGFTANANCGATGAVTCAQVVSSFAQAPSKGSGGTVVNAFSFYAENPSLAVTGEKEGILNQGTTRLADRVAIGSVGALDTGSGLFVYDPNLSGTSQVGIKSTPKFTSAATSAGVAGQFRADVPASTSMLQNYGVQITTPVINAGGSINTWHGLHIAAAPVATTKCAIALDGTTSGTSCVNPPASGGVSNTLPTVAGTLSVSLASGTATLGTSAIAANTCAAVVSVAASGALATDSINWAFNAALGAGYTAGLIVNDYVTAGYVNFLVCNPTASSQTPAAATLNWRVVR